MAQAINLIPFIKKWEGGFSNHPNDPGGSTMYGITMTTFAVYRVVYRLPSPTVDDLKNISDEEWNSIFSEYYWNPFKPESINSQAIANLLVDFGWISGVGTAIQKLQKLGNLSTDGAVGSKTLQFINSQNKYELFDRIWLMRANYFIDIVVNRFSSSVFLKGWINRLYDHIPYCYIRTIKNNNVLVNLVSKLNPKDLKDVQKTISTTQDGIFGNQTKGKLLAYSGNAIKLFDSVWLKLKDQYIGDYIARKISSIELKNLIYNIYKEIQSIERKELF